jgi:hypothetical protein
MNPSVPADPPESEVTVRCPRLGHQIHFAYCRTEAGGLPCFKTIQCWQERFDAEGLLRSELTPAQWRKCFERPPTPKMMSLLELIEQARRQKADPS